MIRASSENPRVHSFTELTRPQKDNTTHCNASWVVFLFLLWEYSARGLVVFSICHETFQTWLVDARRGVSSSKLLKEIDCGGSWSTLHLFLLCLKF